MPSLIKYESKNDAIDETISKPGIPMLTTKEFYSLSDAAVIKKVQEGEVELFEILIRRNNPYVYKIGRSYGFQHDDVEDLMQEAFIAAYLNLKKFEQRSSFKTWLIKIMLSKCAKRASKLSFKNEKAMDTNMPENMIPMYADNSDNDARKSIVNRELNNIIGNALIEIPMDYRMVFSLREINGLSVAETAEALEISEANVKVRLNRSKHMLRKIVEKTYSMEEIFEFNLIYCDKMVESVMSSINKIRTT